jgi:hypothetical protein
MEKFKIILVTWIDCIGADGWLDIKELKEQKPHEHHSLGYLAHETDECITICMSYDEQEETMGAWLCIPKPYIKEIVEL